VFGTRLGPQGHDWDTLTLGWAFAVVMAVYVAYFLVPIIGPLACRPA
jgi:glycerol uptake facilitator-like aquaporin